MLFSSELPALVLVLMNNCHIPVLRKSNSCGIFWSIFCVLQAFTRCAQQEPENGEAWNNIAAIHLQLTHAPEAFSALSEAVKFKRDSWQTWSNYGQAAAQTGNHLPAVRAVQKASRLPFVPFVVAAQRASCLPFLLFAENMAKQLLRLATPASCQGGLKGKLSDCYALCSSCPRQVSCALRPL